MDAEESEHGDVSGDISEPPDDAGAARNRTLITVIVATALAGVAVGAIATTVIVHVVAPTLAAGAGSLGPTVIERATAACDVESDPWITVGDEGRSLSMQSEGTESDGAAIEDIACVLIELETPDSVISRLDSTRALDGRQDAEWDDLAASWGYHPDNGLDIVIETTSE
ncbi:hypothetical protein [Agromyces sp. M3QZ16-3]|uniref:hypothetical protein n=1 Tax=Agromyces sp. M3QZ16-3 TaxID=3447585 RepID=UPI003F68C41E